MENTVYYPPVPTDTMPDFASMTDRELAEYSARTAYNAEQMARKIAETVGKAMEDLSQNPMFKMILGKKK